MGEDRLDRLELLIEQAGQDARLVTSLNEYVQDLKAETASIRRIRLFSLILGVSFIIVILGLLAYGVIFRDMWWTMIEGQYYRAAAVISTLAASVVVVSLVLKGAFKSVLERHQFDVMPDHLKEIIEAYKLVPK